ncbi:MAG: DUF6056 family protein [Synergistaceae bacterium]|nr:DUF6056 family protein [Synergistaceae bacterium]
MKAKVWLGSVFLSIYVGLFAYIARFTVPVGDDYVLNNAFNQTKSIIQTVIEYWLTRNSRFTSIFTNMLGNSLGVMENYYIHAPLTIAFNLFACYFAVTSLFSDIKTSSKILIALLLQSIWLAIAVELGQTLYWFAGVYYTFTCSVLIIEFALIVNIYKGINARIFLCLLGVLVFLNSGASELTAAYQIPMFAGAALFIAVSGDKKCSIHMLIMLLIALAGLVLQLTAPGNSIRISQLLPLLGPNPNPITKSFFMTYKVGVFAGLATSFQFFVNPVIIYALLLFTPVISDNVRQPIFIEKSSFKFKIWHIILFEIVTACCFQAIGGYSMGNSLYPRALGPVRFIMAAQWILFFVFLYRNPKLAEWIRSIRIYKCKEIILLICLLMSSNFILLISDYGIAPEYSRRIAERKEYIRAQKALNKMDIVVPAIEKSPQLLLSDTIPPKESPINDYANYHGANSIREREAILTEALAIARDTEDEDLNQFIAKTGADYENVDPFYKAIEENEEARIRLILLLAEKGSQIAQYTLARYCDTSENLTSPYIQKNDAVALSYYFKLADEGVKDARALLWSFYTGGLRTERDFDIIMWGLRLLLLPF